MDAKLIRNDQLSLSCKLYKETTLTSPIGKTLTSKELAAITALGLDTSKIVSTESNLATLNIGQGRTIKGLSAQHVQALINVLTCAHSNTEVANEDALILSNKYCEFTKSRVLLKPIKITFDTGAVSELTIGMVDYSSSLAAIIPPDYFGISNRLRNIYGYNVKFTSRNTVLNVGCHSYTFDDLIEFLKRIHTQLLT